MFFSSQIKTAYASKAAIASAVHQAHLVIGAVLLPGAAAPKLVTREMVRTMKRGSVLERDALLSYRIVLWRRSAALCATRR